MNKQIITFIIIVILILAGYGIYSIMNDKDDLSDNTVEVTSVEIKNQANEQINNLKEKLNNDPNNPMLLREMGRAYYLLGDLEKANSYFDKINEETYKNPQFYVDKGKIFEATGNFEAAEEEYQKAIDINTKPVIQESINIPEEILSQLSEERRKELQNKTELEAYNSPVPYVAMANLYLDHMDKPFEAIKILLEGTEISPDYPDFYYLLSDAYKATGNSGKAKLYLDEFNSLVK